MQTRYNPKRSITVEISNLRGEHNRVRKYFKTAMRNTKDLIKENSL